MTMEFNFLPPAFWLFALSLLSSYQGGVPQYFSATADINDSFGFRAEIIHKVVNKT